MTLTRYEYDDAGRMVRSVSVTEPDWSPEDVALLVESRVAEQDMGPHGIPMSEATDPANQYAFQGTDFPRIDYAEKARREKADAYYNQYDTDKKNPMKRHGHIWLVKRR